MDAFLSPVSTTYYKSSGADKPLLTEIPSPTSNKPSPVNFEASSVADVIDALKSEPDYDTLMSALRLLVDNDKRLEGFDLSIAGPDAAKIIQILVTETVPNYWALLKEASTEGGNPDLCLLVGALRNLAGINAILLRLRTLIQEQKWSAPQPSRSDILLSLGIYLELLCEVLDGDDRVTQLWSTTSAVSDSVKRRISSKELINVLGGGRIVSLAAEGYSLVTQEARGKATWTADGVEYSKWLSRNIIGVSKEATSSEDRKMAADLLSKAMHLGYPDVVIKIMISDLVNEPQQDTHVRSVFDNLPHSEQRTVLFSLLKALSDLYLNKLDYSDASQEKVVISAVAGVIAEVVINEPKHASLLVTWLTSATGAGLGDAIGMRRAVLAVLASDKDNIISVFEKSLGQFGDYLYIRHTPMLQQEVHAQVLLLSAGYLHRLAPMKLAFQVKSGTFMHMVSKRLEASQTRARVLGMIVGEALSQLVEKSDKKLDFKMEETNSNEALWYKSLTEVADAVGLVDPLRSNQERTPKPQKKAPTPTFTPSQRPTPKPASKPASTAGTAKRIIEVVDSDEDMEDDIKPLTKPEEDEVDSGDDDPETIRRDRPKAPVYIRNLIAYLRDTENYDRQKLALTTAPTLIRRKANYGSEVKEHVEELATLLVGLQDKFDMDNFYDLKLQGMIAIVVAQPQKMGPWFAKTFFDGDYSMAQRSSILTVLGLGARELAGFITSEYALAASFPSQMLPDRMKKLYVQDATPDNQLTSSSNLKALPPNALDTISKSLTSDLMAPIAANAADVATGPDVLKLSTFTSRLDQRGSSSVQKAKAKPRVRAIPNTTAQLIATCFFFPLTARFQAALHSSAGRARGIIFQPYLLSLYLKTLAILLHAAGPSTLALPDMTAELWGLLLGSSVRAQAVGDLGVTHAVLFALLTVLEVNDGRMRDVCQSMGREVVETQEWVAQVFGGMRGEDGSGEEAEVKALAAGCLLRIREGMEKYQSLLMGDMIG